MPRNYITNVGHATVTQLQGISVKYFMERIVFREAITNCLEEFVSDIRFDIRVVRCRLNHITFLFLARFVFACWGLYFNL